MRRRKEMTTTQLEPVIRSSLGFAKTVTGLANLSDLEGKLHLTKKVDEVLSTLEDRRDVISSLSEIGSGLASQLESSTFDSIFDPTNRLIDALERAQEAVKNMIAVTVRRESSVDADARLSAEQRAHLHCGFQEALGAMTDLDQSFDRMRHSIICHDLEHEKPIGPFTDAAKLIASLRADH